MKVGFTGTRHGLRGGQDRLLELLFKNLDIEEFHHGDCIGADEAANEIFVKEVGNLIVIHPPKDPKKRAWCNYKNPNAWGYRVMGEKDYLLRNQDIVNATDLLLVCPKTHSEELRSGTWSTLRYAAQMHKDYIILG